MKSNCNASGLVNWYLEVDWYLGKNHVVFRDNLAVELRSRDQGALVPPRKF